MAVIAKVSAILGAFTAEDRGVGFAELQRRTGLPKATLHRLTGELVEARLLDRVDGRFHLSGYLFALGMRASVERGLLEVATPFLEDLYERTHETVHLGLREGHEVVYVAKMGGHRQARAPSRLGGRMPRRQPPASPPPWPVGQA
jgi:DNA-binding IclR family transcriptional regulator